MRLLKRLKKKKKFALKKLKKPPSEKLKFNFFFPHCQHSPNGQNRGVHVPKCGL